MNSQVWASLLRHRQHQAARIAVKDSHYEITYQNLTGEVDRVAGELRGICPGDRPMIACMDNSPAWVLLDLALLRLNRCAVPLPGFFTPAQREFVANQSGAEFIITEAADGTPGLHLGGKTLHVRHLATNPVPLPAGTAKITFTSGSTGRPKGVCLSVALMDQVAMSLVAAIGEENSGVHCAVLPLSVLLENVAGLYTTLIAGGTYHVPALTSIGFAKPFAPDFPLLLATLASGSITSSILVPELLLGLMHMLAATKQRLPGLKFVAVGGAKVSASLLERSAALGLPVYQGYGLSEAASVVAVNSPRANKSGSVGKLLPHMRVTFGKDGEIFLENPHLLGYVGHPFASRRFATADLGHVDGDGFLFIDGRTSNVLITSFGRNISPEWVES
ncbi:MAG: AMP-binding protein, partial [Aestuariivirga sp.]